MLRQLAAVAALVAVLSGAATPVAGADATAAPTAAPTAAELALSAQRAPAALPGAARHAAATLRTPRGVTAATRQLITVTAGRYGATTATLTAWARVSATAPWRVVFGPMTARVGRGGLAPRGAKREGDGRTPSGVYGFSYAFGVRSNPGTHYRYRRATGSWDVWDDDPTSANYNLWVDRRTAYPGRSPEQMLLLPAYDEGIVIAYNTARTPWMGSAIFFHVGTGSATAGCVSIPESRLTPILRWLRPDLHARMAIGVG